MLSVVWLIGLEGGERGVRAYPTSVWGEGVVEQDQVVGCGHDGWWYKRTKKVGEVN